MAGKSIGCLFIVGPLPYLFLFFLRAAPDVITSEGLGTGLGVISLGGVALPGLFIILGFMLARTVKCCLDFEERCVDERSGPGGPRRIEFDQTGAHIVVVYMIGRKPAHRVLGQEVPVQAGRYEAFACLGAQAIRMPPPHNVSSNASDLFPWVRDTAGQLGVPVELVGEAIPDWRAVMESNAS
jgi:hypothetical protein